MNSCISSHFSISATSAAMPRSPKYLLPFSQSAIIGRGAVAANVVLPTPPSPYTTIRIDGFSVGSKLLKTFIFSFLLQAPVAQLPHFLDEEIWLAVAKLYDFVNTRTQLAFAGFNKVDAGNHELHAVWCNGFNHTISKLD